MVKVMDKTEESAKRKEQARKLDSLIMSFFEGERILSNSDFNLVVFKKDSSSSVVSVFPSKRLVNVFDRDYFERARAFAEAYEGLIKEEVTLRTDYS